MEPTIGLCLTGGGAAGAIQAGMLEGLRPLFHNGAIKAIAGASVGALNGAMAAQGSFDELEETWKTLKRGHIYSRWGLLKIRSGGVFSTGPLRRLIDQKVNLMKLQKSDVRYFAQATDRDTGKAVVGTNEDTDLKNIIYGSAAVPVLFPQVHCPTRGKWLCDGGLIDNSPLDLLAGVASSNGDSVRKYRASCSIIVVLHCHPLALPERKDRSRTRTGMLGHTLRMLYWANQEKDRKFITFFNSLVDRGVVDSPVGKITLFDIYPTSDEDIDTLDFRRESLDRAYAEGVTSGTQGCRALSTVVGSR